VLDAVLKVWPACNLSLSNDAKREEQRGAIRHLLGARPQRRTTVLKSSATGRISAPFDVDVWQPGLMAAAVQGADMLRKMGWLSGMQVATRSS
jgi:hypothetical protein